MKTVNVTFRIDDELKKEAEKLFGELGMSLSTALNVFVRQSVREQQLPFAVGLNTPNKATLRAIRDAKNGKTFGPYESVSELMEALNA